MTGQKVIKCEKALEKLALFLQQNHAIFDVCMVDFITKDIFECLDDKVKKDIMKFSEQDLIDIPRKMIQGSVAKIV